jgi:hypothetical protein
MIVRAHEKPFDIEVVELLLRGRAKGLRSLPDADLLETRPELFARRRRRDALGETDPDRRAFLL